MQQLGDLWRGHRVLVLSPTPSHPQDYGNRKRIYRVCRSLSDKGASVTFLHYAAEAEWRNAIPSKPLADMAATWEQYFTIAPSKGVHPDAKGWTHDIDEWWDESIGDFLKWIFSIQKFDAFIVNYSWLSKAFEYCPSTVFKILDTHDKLSGRRDVLARFGIDPEFFYTTEDQETVALGRANLIWAIKEEERSSFQRMTSQPICVVPHVDPLHRPTAPMPDPDGYFRVGVIGARNNINRINLSHFLDRAIPIFKRAFAPVKLMLAGSMCDMLEGWEGPFVKICGRVPDIDDFYNSVDCVAIPMQFSTGLKIKTGEAISAGVPVLSLAHAFEGYETTNPLHRIESFEKLAHEIVSLSFSPRDHLAELRISSVVSHSLTQKKIEDGLRFSSELMRERNRTIVITVDSRAFVPKSAFQLALFSAYEYLRYLGDVTIFVVKGRAEDVATNLQVTQHFSRVVVARDLDRIGDYRGAFREAKIDVDDLGNFIDRRRPKVLFIDAVDGALYDAVCENSVAFVRLEMVALSSGCAKFSPVGLAFRRVFILAARDSADVAHHVAETDSRHVIVPTLYRSQALISNIVARRHGKDAVALIGDPRSREMMMSAAIARAWGVDATLVCRQDDDIDEKDVDPRCIHIRASDYIERILKGDQLLPHFAVDVSRGEIGLQLCVEFLDRCSVFVASARSGEHAPVANPNCPSRITTEHELWRVFKRLVGNDFEENADLIRARKVFDSDRGWAWIWRFCTQLFEARDIEFI
jgi:hypothetical protein